MKISGAKPPSSSASVGRAADKAYAKAAGQVEKAAPAAPATPIEDVAEISGVPQSELTPKVRHAIQRLMAEVNTLRRELTAAHRRIDDLERLADKDPLLPLYNRRAFVRELSRVISYTDRYGGQASLIYLDLDDFKQVNDAHGHAAGDAVLETVSRVLLDNVRGSDAVARLSGDEFGVILTNAAARDAETKAEILQRLLQEARTPWKGGEIAVTASFGVMAIRSGQTVDETLEGADTAMYARKRDRARAPR